MHKKEPLSINYIYYLLIIVIDFIFVSFTVTNINSSLKYPKAFFILYSYGELIIEVFAIAGIGILIKKYFKKKFFYLFIGLTFLFFIRHIIDYFILKIMDMTIWDGLDLALDENLENFIEMLHTTGIPFFVWIIFFLTLTALPFLAIVFYKITEKITLRKKAPIYLDHLIQTFFIIPLGLLIWDLTASHSINPNIYAAYQRSLPWKVTFVQPSTLKLDQRLSLKKPKSEKEIFKIIDTKNISIEKKPNIFLFIIESTREDFITEDIAPNISKFKKDNISFDQSIANANATHQSWFSLFYSNYPNFWKFYKDSDLKKGSPALCILKNMGYKINAFSAPELKYYSMTEVLFGKNNYLANSFKIFPHYYPVEACDSDIMVMNMLENTLEKESNIYIAFLDSTHFLYSWPKDFNIKFKPVAEKEAFNAYTSKESIELIKNRYKNSINFVDSLLGNFFEKLKEKDLYDDSIIVILADHGEEFYEQGYLFHASHLSSMQTEIPIYLKLGKNERKASENKKMICHMDIFPSIFDFLFGKNIFKDVFKGESIFDTDVFPYIYTTRYNASRSPYEFFIHTGNEKLTLRFRDKKNIFKNQHLEIVSIKDKNDNDLEISSKVDKIKEFETALNKIFLSDQ
ncbi:MAG: sulfatase-like hydrolase/transferase [Parachlamydiales bacterium]|nr:sulfatase-like hydrolase/transferase [Parachlamydiales bacterium]